MHEATQGTLREPWAERYNSFGVGHRNVHDKREFFLLERVGCIHYSKCVSERSISLRIDVMTWNEIKEAVEKNGNVLTMSMEQLRDANGSSKLGVNICAAISNALAGTGIGHIPVELPGYQWEQVRLFKRGTPVGDLISTVLTPGQQNDAKLTGQFAAGGVDHAAIVQKVRELVAE